MLIESLQNSNVKRWSKLVNSKKERDLKKQFLVDGLHLVSEAIKEGIVVEIVISNKKYDQFDFDYKYYVTDEVMKKIVNSKNPQGIAAICMKPIVFPNGMKSRSFIIDGIQDPGNLGTIIRVADAFNFDHIYLSKTSVDVYNQKTIRSTQGSLFRVPVEVCDIEQKIDVLKENGVKLYATSLNNAKPLKEVETYSRMAFVLGNESNGVSKQIMNMTDERIIIEMNGEAESLNVAIAAGIVGYTFQK